MIIWRPFPEVGGERLAPWDGEDFLLALPTARWFGDHDDGSEPYYVITAFWDKDDQCFYARNGEWLDVVIDVVANESFWSEINLPDRRG